VPVLTSHVDPNDETYRANRAAQLAVLDELGKQLELAIAGGGQRYQQRHRERGRLLARERIELLVDPDSPFLELSALAAWGTGFTVGASVVTGIGVISGVECVVIAHDPTVRGGAMNPYSLRKILRALEIARTNRLPVMNLVESGGADLPTQADCSSRPAGSSTSSPNCPPTRCPPWRSCSATRPRGAPTCPACATTRSWWTGRRRCSSAGRRW
jgi:acetyl-CoA carboxylase carboxyltransferase component